MRYDYHIIDVLKVDNPTPPNMHTKNIRRGRAVAVLILLVKQTNGNALSSYKVLQGEYEQTTD